MKRLACLMVLSALLMTLLPLRTLAAPAVSDVMCVVNCSEWVSLRQSPDTKSKRLAQVRLGELVNFCAAVSDDFIQCNYHGSTGYILSKYLKTTAFTNADEILYNQMVVNAAEWVSLRELPDTKSKRLAQVPVGGIVTSCVKEDNFVLCTYKKKTGYIPSEYLKKANYTVGTQDTKVVNKAKANGYRAYQQPMEVVNCKDWVSLREKASASSTRLAKVPLGSFVSSCVQVSQNFVYCKYRNIWGYIQTDYLKSHDAPRATATPALMAVPAVTSPTYVPVTTAAPFGTGIPLPTVLPAVTVLPNVISSQTWTALPAATQAPGTPGSKTVFDYLPALPPYTAFLSAGETVLTHHAANGYTVAVQRAFGESKEEIMAVCYDSAAQAVWQTADSVDEIGELFATNAFIAGTEESPLLVMFTAGKGFAAYEIGAEKNVRWALQEGAALEVSGDIIAKIDADGTIYVIGYQDSAPVCIAPDGQWKWTAVNDNPEVYWPTGIEILEDRIEVYYDTPLDQGMLCDVLAYGKDGNILVSQRKPRK